ncbi:YigZ family protein [Gudongella sp. DL1XJH-153]|uniref:YigZ family protein n=1 Tax=Gudongella sp. DL1XJH-153 TaxID=3409804 RepID=UPI003BB60215
MSHSYKTIASRGVDEFIVNKSRFIGYASPVYTEEEALSFIEEIKIKHKDATHNVSAYVLGENSIIQRFNDDGEPSGTAGIPALEVLKKEEIRNAALVITRYFGGVKLGGGGLIRAYTKGAKIAIESSIIVIMSEFNLVSLKLQYTAYGKIENYFIENGYTPEKVEFRDDVTMEIFVKKNLYDRFVSDMMDMTSGDIKYRIIEEKFLPEKDGVRWRE